MNIEKIFKWLVAILVVVILFFWVNLAIENRSTITPEPVATTTVTETVTENPTYTDPLGFSFSYPHNFILATSSENSLFASGTSLLIPTVLSEGTNLSSDSRIYVESKATSTCSAFAFVDKSQAASKVATNVAINGNSFSTASSSDAGAGNRYDTTVYAIKVNNKCVGVELFVHSTNIQNYDPGTRKEYDKDALNAALRTVLESFKIN